MSDTEFPFHENEEVSIISLVIDFPELYPPIARFVTPDIFQVPEAKYVIAQIYNDFEKHGLVPPRSLLRARLAKQLTVDDPYEDILKIVERESDPREIPFLRESLHGWAESKTYELLYSDEALSAHQRGDYQFLQKIFDDANKIRHTGTQGFWFFDQIDELFIENAVEHIPTGFPGLDAVLNEGGPSPGEVVVWMAPTGVGKSIMLCNQAVATLLQGHDVMLFTFELSAMKTAMRLAANMFKIDIREIANRKKHVKRAAIGRKKGGAGSLVIYDLAPDEHSVDTVYAHIESLKKTRGWCPKVVILDYLELMVSRHAGMNEKDYSKQKSIATEVRGLARNEDVLIHTATQTNRSGVRSNNAREEGGQRASTTTDNMIHLDQVAESYGKNMSVDYVISINQSADQYEHRHAELFVAKNRNGPKFDIFPVDISYNIMEFKEVQ